MQNKYDAYKTIERYINSCEKVEQLVMCERMIVNLMLSLAGICLSHAFPASANLWTLLRIKQEELKCKNTQQQTCKNPPKYSDDLPVSLY